jgi:RNA polymerase sigma-70 factor (ECF subfamily)
MSSDLEAELKPLLVRAQAGDQAAYRAFLTRLAPRLRAFLRGRLGSSGRDSGDVEDILQETLLAIHVARHTYAAESPVTAWVYAIARYKMIDLLRARGRQGPVVPLEAADEVLAREDHTASDTALDLTRALATLPPRTRRLVEALKIEGLSVAEVASRSQMSESAVKVAVHRALKLLARRFAEGRPSEL